MGAEVEWGSEGERLRVVSLRIVSPSLSHSPLTMNSSAIRSMRKYGDPFIFLALRFILIPLLPPPLMMLLRRDGFLEFGAKLCA